MSVDDFNDVLFSQDDRAEIGYGGHNDFVSKLIEKARLSNQNAAKTPPPTSKSPKGRLAQLRKNRRNSKEVESALRALRIPVHSPGPVTRSQTVSGTPTRNPRSEPSLDDSTETLFSAVPPTPPLKRTPKKFTPRNNRVVPFTKSDVTDSSTPVTSTRSKSRIANHATTSSILGLDKSTGSTNSRCVLRGIDSHGEDEDESIEDLLLEATQRAEATYALSQRLPESRTSKANLSADKSNTTPKNAGRIRAITAPKLLQPRLETKPKEKPKSSQSQGKQLHGSSVTHSVKDGSVSSKCSLEEIKKKREAALLRRKQKLNAK